MLQNLIIWAGVSTQILNSMKYPKKIKNLKKSITELDLDTVDRFIGKPKPSSLYFVVRYS